MAEIQGGVVAADINDDGKIELVTTDTHGNVAAWTVNGEEIWEKHLKSLIPQVIWKIFLFLFVNLNISLISCLHVIIFAVSVENVMNFVQI